MFDMDGTLADLYGVENWLEMGLSGDETLYKIAKTLVNMNVLARLLNKLQKKGFEIGVISWLWKDSTKEYDEKVTKVKKDWLKKHLASVHWDIIEIVPHGTNKNIVAESENDVLWDDEEANRKNWIGIAHDVHDIIGDLKRILDSVNTI